MRKRSDVVVSEQRVEESVEQAVDQKMVEQHVQEAALLGSPIDRAAEVAAGLPSKPGFGTLAAEGRIRVVWGEEKICLNASFSPVSVGPFEVDFPVSEGTNVVDALEKASRVLASFAEVERERKVRNFLNKLHQVNDEAKGQRR